MSLPLPRSLGRYEIVSEIGRGMMGVVYQARDPTLGRIVALKTINVTFAVSDAERTLFEQRFMNEARLAAGISHPNIVVVHDVGTDEETHTPYIALEFLKGTLLSEQVPPPLDWREALRIVTRLADALHHAHAQGIVHRDIKPANVMLLPSGEPKIMDFGIARAPTSNLTAAGEFFGTPSYMSPEQAAGDSLDGRSDLFSLGAVLYFLLTGQRAFEGKSVPAILAKVERENPAAPSSIVPGLPATVDQIVARLLEKKPALRYPDGLQLSEDIGDVLEERPPRHATAHATAHGDPTARSKTPPAGPRPATSTEISVVRALEGPRGLFAIGGLLALALLVSILLPAGSATPSPTPPPAAATPRAAASPSTAPAGASTTLAARPKASPGASPQEQSPEPTPARPAARLTLVVEHNVKEGRLTVLVDQKSVLDKPISGKETKRALVFRGRKGELVEVIDLPAGEHTIRVEVQDGEERKAGQVFGVFKKGEARLLEVKIGGRVELELR